MKSFFGNISSKFDFQGYFINFCFFLNPENLKNLVFEIPKNKMIYFNPQKLELIVKASL